MGAEEFVGGIDSQRFAMDGPVIPGNPAIAPVDMEELLQEASADKYENLPSTAPDKPLIGSSPDYDLWVEYRDDHGLTDMMLEAGLAGESLGDYIESGLRDGSIEMKQGESLEDAFVRTCQEQAEGFGIDPNDLDAVENFIYGSEDGKTPGVDGYIEHQMGDMYGRDMSDYEKYVQEYREKGELDKQQTKSELQAGDGAIDGKYDQMASMGLSDAQIELLNLTDGKSPEWIEKLVDVLENLVGDEKGASKADEIAKGAEMFAGGKAGAANELGDIGQDMSADTVGSNRFESYGQSEQPVQKTADLEFA